MQAVIDSFDALGGHLWTLSWQVLVLAAAAGIVEMIARRSSPLFRYWLWIIVLVRLCIPVAIPAPPGLDGFLRGLLPDRPPVIEEIAPIAAPLSMPDLPPMTDLPELSAPVEPVNPTLPPIPPAALFGMVWLVATLGLGTAILWRIRRIRRVLRTCRAVDDPGLRALTDTIAARLGIRRPVRLLACDRPGFEGPAAVGAIRPAILLPAALLDPAEAAALEPVLAHELAHIRRGDLFVNWLQAAFQVAFWFHPAVWLTNYRLRSLREEACDDLAVHALGGERRRYGAGVLRAVELGRATALGFVGLFLIERKRGLARRILRLAGVNYRGAVRLSLPAVLALVLVGAAGIAASGVGAENAAPDSAAISMRDAMNPIEGGPLGQPSVTIPDSLIIRGDTIGAKQRKAIQDYLTGEVGRGERNFVREEYIYISTAWGSSLRPPDTLKRATINLVEAVNRYTNINAKVDTHLFLDHQKLFDSPFVFIMADSAFTLTDAESAYFGEYLRNGGFAFVDNAVPSLDYGPAEASLRQALRDALGDDAKFLPIQFDHPLFHCFSDFDELPTGAEPNSTTTPVQYIEGIWLDGRLAVVYSDNGYAHLWKNFADNEQQLKLGVNMVVFALLQEGGMVGRTDDSQGLMEQKEPSTTGNDSVLLLAPPGADTRLQADLAEAERLRQGQRFGDAVKLLTGRLAELPADASPEYVMRALYLRGICYYPLGRLEEAVADFTRALEITPPYFRDHIVFSRAMVYLDMKRVDEAKREFRFLLVSADEYIRKRATNEYERIENGGKLPLRSYGVAGEPRVLIVGLDRELNPAGVPLTDEQRERITAVFDMDDYRAVSAILTHEQKLVIVNRYRTLLKDSPYPLTREQEARFMAFDSGIEAASWEDIFTPEQMQYIATHSSPRRSGTPSPSVGRLLAPPGTDTRLQIRTISADSVLFDGRRMAIDSLAAALAAVDKDRLAEGLLIVLDGGKRLDTLQRVIAIAREQVGNDIAIGLQMNPPLSREETIELFKRAHPDTSAAARGITAPYTGGPRGWIEGLHQELEPAGLPLTDTQQERIMKVYNPFDLRAAMEVLTREQKQVIVAKFRDDLANSEHPLTEDQEARIMAFGPDGKDTSVYNIITQEQWRIIANRGVK